MDTITDVPDSISGKCLQCKKLFKAKIVFGKKEYAPLYEEFCGDDCIDKYNQENGTEIKK